MEPFIALVTAVVVLSTALVGYMAKLRKDVSEIHVMVNSRMAEALARIEQLEQALEGAGVDTPRRPGRHE
jgi:hypothetical protein